MNLLILKMNLGRFLSVLFLFFFSFILLSHRVQGQSMVEFGGAGVDSESTQSRLNRVAGDESINAVPGDVLNPDSRGNSPNVKVALKGGLNRASFTNDRFLDNRPFDVGAVYGEDDLYGSGAGFGWQFGLEVEIPRNTVFSWTVGGRYDHISVGNRGVVGDPCRNTEGDTVDEKSFHRYDMSIDYLKLAGAAKLNFQRFYLLIGLTVGTPMRNDLQFEQSSGATSCVYNDPNDLRSSNGSIEIPEISRLHFAFRLGGGLTYQLSDRLQFSPELTLDFGVNAINKSPESDLGVYAISGVLRYDL
ncbi:MAG: hypothetical protein KDD67_13270 [Ignavibacteriae bacterium]|nr:hypothetical protein [Ignavibacteriota bacterium]MCB9214448.1 hypothetical protein [Ignavibacteria bacterium]